ncbi:MAG: ComEC/Rec2 family competence protein [Acidobacteria bacterium]|nr:ComEC/Rec2 family competence protein [Acidobacteriota bacterium]
MAAICSLPWLLPETWDGHLPTWFPILGWLPSILLLPLVKTRRWKAVPLLVFALWAALLGLGRLASRERSLPVGLLRLEGRVSSVWTPEGSVRRGRVSLWSPPALAGLDIPVTLPLDGEAPPGPGTPVRFLGDLRAVEPAPRFLGERPLWRARGEGLPRRVALASSLQFERLGPPEPGPLLRLQAFVRSRFEALPLPAGTARDLWGALTLGIPPAREEATSPFVESGTIHTLVVSGLQVTLVMAAVEALWRRRLFRRGASLAACTAGLLYAALVGFSAPVWRGLAMGLAWALGRGTGWKLPPAWGLHGALGAWMLLHPACGADPGFLLAWWALLGLLWAAEPLGAFLRPLLGDFSLPLARLLAPWLTTLPLLALFHGGVPTFGVFANLLVLPLVSVLTPVCLFLTLLPVPGITPTLGAALAWTGEKVVPLFGHITPLATACPWAWSLLAAGWLALAHAQGTWRRTRALLLVLGVASFTLLGTRGLGRPARTLELEALDVGQGDALILRIPGGDATLVDTGPNPWAARRLARVLSRRGVHEPLHLVLTHPHGDHAGGWSTLARLRPFASVRVPELADSGDWGPFAPAGGPLPWPSRRGEEWTRGEGRFHVMWPPKAYRLPDPNMVSLVLRVVWKDRELWLMGDALDIQEGDLLDLGDPPRNGLQRLLKAGHHGGGNASTEPWIRALGPDLALVCAGRRNPFGHPHAATLGRFAVQGIPTFVTGPEKGVRVLATGAGWTVLSGTGGQGLVSRKPPAPPGSE